MNLPEGYVDGFGVVYSAGIILPTDITILSQSNRHLRLENGGYNTTQNNKSCHISFRAVTFVSQEAKEAGKRPLNFLTANGIEYFNFEVPFEEMPTTDASLVALCEDHLTTVLAEV